MFLKALGLFGLLVVTFINVSAHALVVISDLDDTIKITQVRSQLAAVYNGLLGNQVFSGMPELFQGFKIVDNKTEVLLVSGSPKFIRYNVNRLMAEQNIPADVVYLLGDSKKKAAFLLKEAGEIQDDIILMGDDQEFDPQFYEAVQKAYPEKVKAIYIHQVNNKKLPEGQIGFFTAYEIALNEVKAGRLQPSQALNVKEKIEKDLNLNVEDPFISQRVSEGLIPTWHKCTKNDFLAQARKTSLELGMRDDQIFFDRLNSIVQKNCQD